MIVTTVKGKTKNINKVLRSHAQNYTLTLQRELDILWMDPKGLVDLSLCIAFLKEAMTYLDKVKKPIYIILDLSDVTKFDSSCSQCFQTPEFQRFIVHPKLAGQIFINEPAYVRVMIQLARLFTQGPIWSFHSKTEATAFLAERQSTH